MRLSVDLTDTQKQHLDDLAGRLQVAPEILAAAALRDLLARRESDFEAAAARVLEKNAELYRRLA
jgi:predicted transcriptional regulator